MAETTIKINANVEPLMSFLLKLDRYLEIFKLRERRLEISDLCFEFARIETDSLPTSANEIGITFYPSDAFLRFAVALGASDINLGLINES